jgi:hypothetical protein
VSQTAGALAALGALLAVSLRTAAEVAAGDRDRSLCEAAAHAAAEIHQLLAAGDDETVTW